MKKEYSLMVKIPDGISCEFSEGVIKCRRGNDELSRNIPLKNTQINLSNKEITFFCKEANKKNIAGIKTMERHLYNLFNGLKEEFSYELEICNVHFPITVKNDGNKLLINNFLGEKKSRIAEILIGVKVDVNGQKIKVSAKDIEKAGQTAANIEKATRVSKRDRRVFQDGIYITKKPGSISKLQWEKDFWEQIGWDFLNWEKEERNCRGGESQRAGIIKWGKAGSATQLL